MSKICPHARAAFDGLLYGCITFAAICVDGHEGLADCVKLI